MCTSLNPKPYLRSKSVRRARPFHRPRHRTMSPAPHGVSPCLRSLLCWLFAFNFTQVAWTVPPLARINRAAGLPAEWTTDTAQQVRQPSARLCMGGGEREGSHRDLVDHMRRPGGSPRFPARIDWPLRLRCTVRSGKL